jgi:hypothetical protein
LKCSGSSLFRSAPPRAQRHHGTKKKEDALKKICGCRGLTTDFTDFHRKTEMNPKISAICAICGCNLRRWSRVAGAFLKLQMHSYLKMKRQDAMRISQTRIASCPLVGDLDSEPKQNLTKAGDSPKLSLAHFPGL